MTQKLALAGLFRLDGQVAVITGAASGIGKATAQLLADAGAAIVVADRDADGAKQVAGALRSPAARAEKFDLEDEASIEALFDSVGTAFGRLDILVNNAGIYPKYALIDLKESDWQTLQRVNVWGCFVAMRAAARLMRAGGRGGRIVNISSIGGVRNAVHDQIAYNASKAALDSMTLSAALEFAADNILVNSVLPGAVAPFDAKTPAPGHRRATGPLMDPGRILLGRPASAGEIAGPILMLASAAGGYMTGQTIIVDGGFSIS